ncbi:MAG: DUF2147 domain-containing protein [Chromatiales bacterium]
MCSTRPALGDSFAPDNVICYRSGLNISAAVDQAGERSLRVANNGKTYKCKVELSGSNILKIRGYAGAALFGRTELWTRSAESERSASD